MCASVSIRWVIGLSRLVGVASGGFSGEWRHVWIGRQNSVASIGAKLGSFDGVSCVWRLFVAVSSEGGSAPAEPGVRRGMRHECERSAIGVRQAGEQTVGLEGPAFNAFNKTAISLSLLPTLRP